ncbi:tripartite tricarboxylate transporter substrate binding protein [soil metagenome]
MSISRRQALAGAAALGWSGWTSQAMAQGAWPTMPIRVISPGSAGGGSDILVRCLEAWLGGRLGQSIFIENHPGAAGMVAAGIASTARPDGYTFFVSSAGTNGVAVHLYKKLTFDPKKDLPAVARIATLTNALAVRSDSGINSVADFVAYVRANPKKAFFGSAGNGTSAQLGALLLGQRIGVEMSHIPYKGTGANLNALLAGEILFSMDNLFLYSQHVKAGTLKLLAVTSKTRSPFYPDLPTLQESGIPDFDITSWYGLSAATGTPQPIIDRMSKEIVAGLGDPTVMDKIRSIGAEPAPMSAREYADFIVSESPKWEALVKLAGAKID